ncbi:hypothetical protein NDU88_004099 [Pleurodeles waltl]|uniref:Uncharacterized protein n=1 Tax=Pleurodeles waltl TaxID=8319 RepID=A0AAV7MW98_PLEWA|nr:hypothetical protein NDU88_004099 [Pleurodeles waltl]
MAAGENKQSRDRRTTRNRSHIEGPNHKIGPHPPPWGFALTFKLTPQLRGARCGHSGAILKSWSGAAAWVTLAVMPHGRARWPRSRKLLVTRGRRFNLQPGHGTREGTRIRGGTMPA